MVREVFHLPSDNGNSEPEAANIAQQQWQPAQVQRAAGPNAYDQQIPNVTNEAAPYPTVTYQPRPSQWQNPGGNTGDGPVSPSGRSGYGVSGSIPTDGGGTTTYPGSQQPPYGYPQPGSPYNPTQGGYPPAQPGYQGGYPPPPPGYQGGAPPPPGYTGSQPSPQAPSDSSPAPSSSKDSGGGIGVSNVVDWIGTIGGSALARKAFTAGKRMDPSVLHSDPTTLTSKMGSWEDASGAYTGALTTDIKQLKGSLQDMARARGFDPEKALTNPDFEATLGGSNLTKLQRYRAFNTDLENINGYWERLSEAKVTPNLKDVPPASAVNKDLMDGIGVTRTAWQRYNRAQTGLSEEMGNIMKQQEGELKSAGMKNLGVLGGAMAGDLAVDNMFFKGVHPSARTMAFDSVIPFISLIPKGNMLVKIGSMVFLHSIFRGLDQMDQQNNQPGA